MPAFARLAILGTGPPRRRWRNRSGLGPHRNPQFPDGHLLTALNL
jgi:hypothetical protein